MAVSFFLRPAKFMPREKYKILIKHSLQWRDVASSDTLKFPLTQLEVKIGLVGWLVGFIVSILDI